MKHFPPWFFDAEKTLIIKAFVYFFLILDSLPLSASGRDLTQTRGQDMNAGLSSLLPLEPLL